MFYISALYLLYNDMLPTNEVEVVMCIFFVVVGSMSFSVLVAQFSTLLEEMTKKQRVENEKVDFIQGMMYQMRLPEDIQIRILDYYECFKKSKYIIGNQNIKILSPSLQEKVALHQLKIILKEIPVLQSTDTRLAIMFSKFTKIHIFLPGKVSKSNGPKVMLS
jgi:hypothetical protein